MKLTKLQKTILENNNIPKEKWASFLKEPKRLNWPKVEFENNLAQYFRTIGKEDLIVVHGDYDCDGMTGSVVMYRFLKHFGYNVKQYLPSRERGYGINKLTIDEYSDAKLFITVDCGISNINEVEYAKSKGIDVIITDHHTVPDKIPDAKFILHPKVVNIQECNHLAGVGVSFWFCKILARSMGLKGFDFDKFIALVSIGTIGDMTPLLDFNRDVVKYGLQKLKENKILGIERLLDYIEIDTEDLDEEKLAFQVIPRLNASGRVKDPIYSFALLATEHETKVNNVVKAVCHFNQKRKDICKEFISDIESRYKGSVVDHPIFIIDDFPHGIVGLIAGNLAEKYQVPVFICSHDSNNIVRGSARCPEWFDLIGCLNSCSEKMIKYGGHKQAAGFSFYAKDYLGIESALNEYYEKAEKEDKQWNEIYLDGISNEILSSINEEIKILKPFGMKHPQPNFAIKGVEINGLKKYGQHQFGSVGGVKACYFFSEDNILKKNKKYDIIFNVMESRNPKNNEKEISINLKKAVINNGL